MREHLIREASRILKLVGSAPVRGGEQVRDVNGLHEHIFTQQAGEDPLIFIRMHGPLEFLPAIAHTPSVKCICVLRDARDVVLSRVARGDPNVGRYVLDWQRFVAMARQLEREERVYIVRFEELVTDSERIAEELGEWLGIDLNLSSPDTRWPDHSSFGPLPKRIEPTAARRWQGRRNEEVVRFVGYACRKELLELGYPASDEVGAGAALSYERRLAFNRAHMVLGHVRRRLTRHISFYREVIFRGHSQGVR